MTKPWLPIAMAITAAAAVTGVVAVTKTEAPPPKATTSPTAVLPSAGPGAAPPRLVELSSGPVERAVVIRLASALGQPAPVRVDRGWQAGRLIVQDRAGQPWCLTEPFGGPVPAQPFCVQGEPSGRCASPPVTDAAPLSRAQVLAVTGPVLAAVGLTVEQARITSRPQGTQIWVDPIRDTLATVGVATRLTLTPPGAISAASGQLAAGRPGVAYPLVSAREALAQLPGAPAGPAVLASARLALAPLPLGPDRLVLAPTWVFTVPGREQPVTQLAVRPAPTPSPIVDLTFTVSPDGLVLTVRTSRGVCPDIDDTLAVVEQPDGVVVRVIGRPVTPGVPCPAVARLEELPVRLAAPLGHRGVSLQRV